MEPLHREDEAQSLDNKRSLEELSQENPTLEGPAAKRPKLIQQNENEATLSSSAAENSAGAISTSGGEAMAASEESALTTEDKVGITIFLGKGERWSGLLKQRFVKYQIVRVDCGATGVNV